MLRRVITFMLGMFHRLWMKVPRLLKNAVERFAARPINAISLPDKFCPSKMIPKTAPQVQLIPKMIPQQVMLMMVKLYFLQQLMYLLIPLSATSLMVFSDGAEFKVLLSSWLTCCISSGASILSLRLKRKKRVLAVEIIPTIIILKLSWSISNAACTFEILKVSLLAMYCIPQSMQQLMPSTGKKRGMELAYPFCQSGNNFSSPQGAVMIGICDTATTPVKKSAMSQLVPAIYLPTAPMQLARVDSTTKMKQFLLRMLNIIGLTIMQKMLKLLESNSILVLLYPKQACASGRMARQVPIIINIVTETRVTEIMRAHSNIMLFYIINTFKLGNASTLMENNNDPQGFFDLSLTNEFVAGLDNSTYAELVHILTDNYMTQFATHRQKQQQLNDLHQQVQNGQENCLKLKKIQVEHAKMKNKLKCQLQGLDEELEQAKKQLREI